MKSAPVAQCDERPVLNREVAGSNPAGGSLAIVCQVVDIRPHPNADRLEVVTLGGCAAVRGRDYSALSVVTGPHYEVGQLGIYIAPGALLPGWLAEDLWITGRGSSNRWVPITSRNMRGVDSPGIFVGCKHQNDRTRPWEPWRPWHASWQVGDDVSAYLGIVAAVPP